MHPGSGGSLEKVLAKDFGRRRRLIRKPVQFRTLIEYKIAVYTPLELVPVPLLVRLKFFFASAFFATTLLGAKKAFGGCHNLIDYAFFFSFFKLPINSVACTIYPDTIDIKDASVISDQPAVDQLRSVVTRSGSIMVSVLKYQLWREKSKSRIKLY